MNDDATPAKVRLTDGLGLAPERAAVERLMKRRQIGVGPRQMGRGPRHHGRVLRHPGPAAD